MPRYTIAASWNADWQKLTMQQQQRFLVVLARLIAYMTANQNLLPGMPLVRPLKGAHGWYEIRIVPNGAERATFIFDTTGPEPVVRWQRIGDHSILP